MLVHLLWNVDVDVWEKTVYACGEFGCQRHYDITHGYYSISEERIDRSTKTRVPCPRDELPMHLYEYEPQGSVGKWMCAQFGCKCAKETRGPF
jgi:hypothetical protein